MTRCNFFKSKSDALYFFLVKIWRVVFFSTDNLTCNEIFNKKSCFSKKHENCKICRFHGVKWTKTWFFKCDKFFEIRHVEQFLIQNQTGGIYFNPKSDAFHYFYFKIWHVVKVFIQNLLSKSSFQILTELLSNCCRHQRTTWWIMTMAWGKKFFYECVACVCLTFGTIFFGDCALYVTWFLDGCDDYIICTTNWFIHFSLEFKKWLVYKDFILKDTKLPVKLPWTSRKQSRIFTNSNSNLVSLTCSFLSANTDPLVCVDLVFWKELNKGFFLRSLFFAMLGILSTPLFCWLKWTALCKLSKNCPLSKTILPLKLYLKSVYRQSMCW